MMKSLREFWKSFRKKDKTTKAELREKPEICAQIKPDSFAERRELIEPTPILKKKREKVHIQVGLDFGTSTTKVVFSQIGRSSFRVINFNHKLSNYPSFCIPSICAFGDNGHLSLGVSAARSLLNKEWDYGLQRLKVVVAGKHDNNFKDSLTEEKYYNHFKEHNRNPLESEKLTAIFLAYVMQKTRKVIRGLSEYRNVDLDMAFNICMPIDHIENNNLKPVFEKIFHLAELIEYEWAKNDKGFNPLKAAYALENCSTDREPKVFAIPEAVASFASYLKSLEKKEGLHAIIDFGAGTTDLSICNLFLNAESIRNYWYAARNIPRGTIRIERALASNIAQISGSGTCTSNDMYKCLYDLTSALSNRNKTQIDEKLNNVIVKELCDLRDSKEYKETWRSAYRHLKKDSLWGKVEIFTCGGGSNLPNTDKAFSKPCWPGIKNDYHVSKLPTPDNYDPGESGAPFGRMSVAYGLAIPKPQLDEYILPNDSPDHTPELPPIRILDHEEMYSD